MALADTPRAGDDRDCIRYKGDGRHLAGSNVHGHSEAAALHRQQTCTRYGATNGMPSNTGSQATLPGVDYDGWIADNTGSDFDDSSVPEIWARCQGRSQGTFDDEAPLLPQRLSQPSFHTTRLPQVLPHGRPCPPLTLASTPLGNRGGKPYQGGAPWPAALHGWLRRRKRPHAPSYGLVARILALRERH